MSNQGKIRILVVEDYPSWQMTLEYLLGLEGYIVDIAETVEIGLSKLKQTSYHLVVVDLSLGAPEYEDTVGRGELILNEIAYSKPKIPAITVTGWSSVSPKKVRDLFKNYDINDFFWKSEFDPTDFKASVERCLQLNGKSFETFQDLLPDKKHEVFLAHPYDEIWFVHLKEPLDQIIENSGYKLRHPADAPPGGRLWHRIAEMIRYTKLGLYDITEVNGNVNFELGYAMGNYKPYFVLIDSGMKEANAVPRILRGELLVYYDSEAKLEQTVTDILNEEHGYHFFYENLDSIKNEIASSPTALILTANVPRQRGFEKHIKTALDELNYASCFLHVESQNDLTLLAKILLRTTLVVGAFAASNRVGAEEANAELALFLGFAFGIGIPTIIMQEEPAIVLADLETIVKTYRRSRDIKNILETSILEAEIDSFVMEQNLPFQSGTDIDMLIQQNNELRKALADYQAGKDQSTIRMELKEAADKKNWTTNAKEFLNKHQDTIYKLVIQISGDLLRSGMQGN